jgi:hypothetical protein
VEREIETGMREFLAYSLDRSPRSLAFLDEVRAGHAARIAAVEPTAPVEPVATA